MTSRTMLTALMLTLLFCAVHYVAEANGATADPQPGVARDLARFRAAHYSNVRYKLQIELAAGAEMLKGAEEIRVTLDAEVTELILDWRTAPGMTGVISKDEHVWGLEVNGHK